MSTLLAGWKRTGMCAAYTAADVGKEVTLMGWVDNYRNLGGLIFVWLRDRSGIIQLVFDEKTEKEVFSLAESLRNEFVIAVKGEVLARTEENINAALKTGEIEIRVQALKVISKATTPPFEITEDSNVKEELRLKYRYLDLRRPDLQKNMILRSKLASVMRTYMEEEGFLEIETPILQKSTPEGARDYLVPSRIHQGSFYALPQSPQIFKQLLMVAGMDRYYQLAKCFRDEDLRADRQPEFTQLDMELSFVDAEDVMEVNEGLLKRIIKEILGEEISLPLRRIPYTEAMERYGSDKPDTRFGLELIDVSEIVKDSNFQVFQAAVAGGGSVRAINAKGAGFSRKEIDAFGEFVKTYGAKGLAWINYREEGISSPIAKFLSEETLEALLKKTEAEPGDVLFFIADTNQAVFTALGALRLEIGTRLGLIDESKIDLLWVTEFPMFEYSEEDARYVAMHHPFTSPLDEDIEYLESDPGRVRAKAYDIVLNGNEIGGGSIRIHDAALQERVFRALGFSEEKAWERFGFMMGAFQYGTPPHGGLAYGFDRMVMILAGTKNIRDVIAFPKAQNAADFMSEAPAPVEMEQLEELGIQIVRKKDE
ncbi:MAG: aspartate--tRNA ligase [Christensenellaceae bacterium]|jgi:aspartyl-tRNA synthetase